MFETDMISPERLEKAKTTSVNVNKLKTVQHQLESQKELEIKIGLLIKCDNQQA